jgi:hypothetical protein
MVTLNVATFVLTVAVDGGWVVKARWSAVNAEAGDAETSSAPVVKRAEQAPTDRTLLSVERSDRPPPRFLIMCMVIPLSIKLLLLDINQCLI